MKIAVYTIAKNEEQFVGRWANSCLDADYRIILDTGSTDNTVGVAQQEGVSVYKQVFDPWRFDVARNHSLSLVPSDVDVCIALDMDEILLPGWRAALEESFDPGVDRYRYKYVWSWNEDGSEGLVYGGDKIHTRHGMSWTHPVHEVLKKQYKGSDEVQKWVTGLQIHHHPDSSKPRSQYFPLLELAVSEDPNDDRNRFYLGREYFFYQRFSEAKEQFEAHLRLSRWSPERAASCRYLSKIPGENKKAWLYKALTEDQSRKETWVDLALCFYEEGNWGGCWWACTEAMAITEKPLDYLCEAYAWGHTSYDLAALSAYHLGMYDKAVELGMVAVKMAPKDDRLANNWLFYRAARSSLNVG